MATDCNQWLEEHCFKMLPEILTTRFQAVAFTVFFPPSITHFLSLRRAKHDLFFTKENVNFEENLLTPLVSHRVRFTVSKRQPYNERLGLDVAKAASSFVLPGLIN